MAMDFPQTRRWPALLLGLVVGAGCAVGALWYFDQQADNEAEVDTVEVETTTAVAETRDLISYDEWAATLTTGTPGVVAASGPGTITRNADVGDVLTQGDVIAEIDGAIVVALYGAVPQFRELSIDSEDGADIRQLEENLVALGFDPDHTVTVDDDFTYNTGEMIERWEEELGFEEPDQIVDAGQVAFITGISEVTSTTAVGSQVQPGQSLLVVDTVSETGLLSLPTDASLITELVSIGTPLSDGMTLAMVTTSDGEFPVVGVVTAPNEDREDAFEVEIEPGAVIAEVLLDRDEWLEAGWPLLRWELPQGAIEMEVAVGDSDTFEVGTALQVELPDETIIDASVTEKSDVARTVQVGQETATVVDVSIEPVEPIAGDFSAGPVTVRTQDDAVIGATVIPARALVALAEGGHAIDIEGRGLVAVDLGVFDEGWVEVTNGIISPGEQVIVPS